MSFLEMLSHVDIDEPPDILNLDSGQVDTVCGHAWDGDATDWLDNLIEELDEQSKLESFENDLDFTDFVEDMTPDEWKNVRNDVIDNFDSNLFV